VKLAVSLSKLELITPVWLIDGDLLTTENRASYSVPLGPTAVVVDADEDDSVLVIANSPSDAFGPPTTEEAAPASMMNVIESSAFFFITRV